MTVPIDEDSDTRSVSRRLDDQTAAQMLQTDFEQAFVLHNDYKDAERDLFKLSLKILAFPGIMAGALLSAKLIASPSQLDAVLQLPLIWYALIAAGVLNMIVVRAYVVTDRVQTEAKHQVNRLRSLYLHALADKFPPGWEPVWGSVNPYLNTKFKLKAAVLTPLVLGIINALYVAYGIDRLLEHDVKIPWHLAIAIPVGTLYFLVQIELTWDRIRKLSRASKG